ncbi:hypothetical protein SGI37_20565, partial [Providencia rettgeri]
KSVLNDLLSSDSAFNKFSAFPLGHSGYCFAELKASYISENAETMIREKTFLKTLDESKNEYTLSTRTQKLHN